MKKKMNPVWFLIIGIVFLIIPTAIYLGFLIPQMKEEYIILMSSGGAIGGAGTFGSQMISEETKTGKLFKMTAKSFTLLVVVTLVQKFINQLIGLAVVIVLSYIIFTIFKWKWKDGRQERSNERLATEVARNVVKASK